MKRDVRLIVADANDSVRLAVYRVAAEFCSGIKVIAQARNYGEVMRALDSMQCDVVLMDLSMPAEVPVEPAVLKAHLGHTCLLAMSARINGFIRDRARAFGAVELLEKAELDTALQIAVDRCMWPKWMTVGR
jgi:DNA-binding NarL/FixJ family response regulator